MIRLYVVSKSFLSTKNKMQNFTNQFRNKRTLPQEPSNKKEKRQKTVHLTDLKQNRKNSESIIPFSFEGPLEEQISHVIANIEADSNYFKNISKIHNNLHSVTKLSFKKNFKIMVFGSAFTNLALKNSDVDFYINVKDIQSDDPINLCKLLRKNMYKSSNFQNIILIHTRVPVLKCIHDSGIPCDINISGIKSVNNSKLIKFLVETDGRLRPLILIIKYLLKRENLCSSNAITSYTLILLIIFFLQQLKNPLLPPIIYLQKLETYHVVDEWNLSFSSELKDMPKVDNKMTIPELIISFYKFYSTFEFGLNVICPFTGKSYLKSVFANVNEIPEEFSLYKANLHKANCGEIVLNSFLCLQDPFIHCANIGRHITQYVLLQFQSFCSRQLYELEEFKRNEGLNFESKFFAKLLNLPNHTQNNKKDAIVYVGPNLNFKIDHCTKENLVNQWFLLVINKLSEIIFKVLKGKITIKENELSTSATIERDISFEFSCFELVTKSRKEARNKLEFTKDMCRLRQEELISNYICDNIANKPCEEPMKFIVNARLKEKPTRVIFLFKYGDNSEINVNTSENMKVEGFFNNAIIKWLQLLV